MRSKTIFTFLFLALLIVTCKKTTCEECASFYETEFEEISITKDNGTLIKKGDDSFVSQNFRASDFFIKNRDHLSQFYIAKQFVPAMDSITSWVNKFNQFYGLDVDVKITSTVRSHKHNKRIGGAKNSLHLHGKAIDFQFTKANKLVIALFHLEYMRNGKIRQQLESLGISSFIFYETHIHIAMRREIYFEDKRHKILKEIFH